MNRDLPDNHQNYSGVMQVLYGISGALAIAAGAFGAHSLKETVSPMMLDVWRTASHYHLIHAVAGLLLTIILKASQGPFRDPWANRTLICWMAGTLFFSGSLYGLVLSNVKWLGAVTPFGGLFFIAGWLCTSFIAAKRQLQVRSQDGV